jgi:catechol-2,3-dioxygenase
VLDPDGNDIELFVDVLPESSWQNDPGLVMAPTRPLAL